MTATQNWKGICYFHFSNDIVFYHVQCSEDVSWWTTKVWYLWEWYEGTSLSVCLSVCLSVYLCLSVCLFISCVCTSVCLPVTVYVSVYISMVAESKIIFPADFKQSGIGSHRQTQRGGITAHTSHYWERECCPNFSQTRRKLHSTSEWARVEKSRATYKSIWDINCKEKCKWCEICLSICMSVCLYVCLSVRLSVCLSVCLSICMSVCMSVYLYVCLSICLSICKSVCLSICMSVYL